MCYCLYASNVWDRFILTSSSLCPWIVTSLSPASLLGGLTSPAVSSLWSRVTSDEKTQTEDWASRAVMMIYTDIISLFFQTRMPGEDIKHSVLSFNSFPIYLHQIFGLCHLGWGMTRVDQSILFFVSFDFEWSLWIVLKHWP